MLSILAIEAQNEALKMMSRKEAKKIPANVKEITGPSGIISNYEGFSNDALINF